MTQRRRIFVGMAVVVVAIVVAALLTHGGLEVTPPEQVTGPVGAPTRIVTPEPTPPPWTGSLIAAALARPTGSDVVLIELGSTDGPWLLTDTFDEVDHLAWSPDGKTLALAARRASNWDLYLLDRNGTEMTRLTDHPAYDGGPAWSPDGRALAFTSARDGNLEVYRLELAPTLEAGPQRLTHNDSPDIEPAWTPDGAHVLFSAWGSGRYELQSVEAGSIATTAGAEPAPAAGPPVRVEPAGGAGAGLGRPVDLRRVTGLPGADGGVAYMESEHGVGPLMLAEWDPVTRALSPGLAVAASASNHAWHPSGHYVATLRPDRRETDLAIREVASSPPGQPPRRQSKASVPIAELESPTALAWTEGPAPRGLPALDHEGVSLSPTDTRSQERWNSEGHGEFPNSSVRAPPAKVPDGRLLDSAGPSGEIPGLVRVELNVPGNRINAALLDDYSAMRAEILAATGHDFLGTLSDLWRPLGFDSAQSAFFSWHKTGRAFDTQMELRGPGGRSDMVLVRESVDGRTMWRMHLRAAAQDGSVGQPLTVPGWLFSAGGGDERFEATGGLRNPVVPSGYWVDFTRIAERYGWQRIPSLTRSGLDWRRDWAAIEYWHYERRDGLRWFEAMAELYPPEELEAALHPDVLRAQGISVRRLVWLGFPEEWRGG